MSWTPPEMFKVDDYLSLGSLWVPCHQLTACYFKRCEEGTKCLGHLQKCSKSLNSSFKAAPVDVLLMRCLLL